MTIFERRAPRGTFAEAPPSTMEDIARAQFRSMFYVENSNARKSARLEAFDERIETIFKATGVRVDNPELGHGYQSTWLEQRARGEVGPEFDRYDIYKDRLDALKTQFPDHADVIGLGMEPLEVAREKARGADRAVSDTLARYRGPPGTGTMAALAGGVAGALADPLNVATMAVGPYNAAKVGISGLLWMGVKMGAVNAAVETALQPSVASWRREAGLQYDASTFAMNVASAGVFGFAADVGVRGGVRAFNRARGNQPILNVDNGIVGWNARTNDALETASMASTDPVVRAAADLDLTAIRRLADETGVINDPEFKAALEAQADLEAAMPRLPDVDGGEQEAALLQGLRHFADPREPVPLEPLPVARAAAPDAIEPPDVVAARARLKSGDLDAVEAAQIMRRVPQAVDESVSLASQPMRDARGLQRLSDAAFERVQAGEIEPQVGAMVGGLVEDPVQHARILDELRRLRPESAADARQIISAYSSKLVPDDDLLRGGIDDPIGADGLVQRDSLRARLQDDIADAVSPMRPARLDDEIEGLAMASNLAAANRTSFLADLMGACKA